jgi:hypothetical protein
MSFLPDNYREPSSSDNYFKIKKDCDNKFRILSSTVRGWEDWTLEKKPIRFRENEKPVSPIDPTKPVRFFWAFIVHNIDENKIQIMQITQATIRKSILGLIHDKDWGIPFHYDIKIKRSGEGKDTEYNIIPVNQKPLTADVIEMFNNTPCNLEALFDNQDPFSLQQCQNGVTPLGISGNESVMTVKSEIIPVIKYISNAQLDEFMIVRGQLLEKDKKDVDQRLMKLGVHNYAEMPVATFELFMPSIVGRIAVSA